MSMLDGVEAYRASGYGSPDPGNDIDAAEGLQQAKNLNELPFAAPAHPGFEKPAEGGALFGQIPADQRCRLVEGAGLLL